jgi:hypothetical protein
MADTLGRLETDTYRSRFDDGLLDLFIGLALVFIGAIWLWFEDFAGLAGIIPAILAMPFALWRNKFIERRAGYVKFSDARRSWERRNLLGFVIGGVGLFAFGTVAVLFFERGGSARDVLDWLAPGIIALLIALMVGVLAVVSRLPRLAAYTALLVAGGIGAAALDTNPGVPLLIAGAIVTVWGAVLTTRFVREHPVTEEA